MWVLIFLLNSSGNATKVLEMHDFTTKASCQAAIVTISKEIKPDLLICVEK